MKTEKELKEILIKLENILSDEFLQNEILISPNQKQRIRIKIGMINSILEKDAEL